MTLWFQVQISRLLITASLCLVLFTVLDGHFIIFIISLHFHVIMIKRIIIIDRTFFGSLSWVS